MKTDNVPREKRCGKKYEYKREREREMNESRKRGGHQDITLKRGKTKSTHTRRGKDPKGIKRGTMFCAEQASKKDKKIKNERDKKSKRA